MKMIENKILPDLTGNESYNQPFIVAWWSAGITSAVACKMALEMYENVEIYYEYIDTSHEDNARFMADCERWYGRKIKTIKSTEFNNQYEVIEKTGAVNTPYGAPCTLKLKKEVRWALEKKHELSLFNSAYIKSQVWGYEFEKKQVNRAIRHLQQYRDTNPLFPLIEKGITKDECAGMIISAGIELPEMYKLGYPNNNCIGCVKGGEWYWNKIRVDFPTNFNRMAQLERKVGYSCLNGKFLDELNPKAGRKSKMVMPNCGNICEVEFADLPDVNLELIMSGRKTIYEAA